MAVVCYDVGDYDKCISELVEVLKKDVSCVDALYYMGLAKMKTKQFLEAKTFFKQALDLTPTGESKKLALDFLKELPKI